MKTVQLCPQHAHKREVLPYAAERNHRLLKPFKQGLTDDYKLSIDLDGSVRLWRCKRPYLSAVAISQKCNPLETATGRDLAPKKLKTSIRSPGGSVPFTITEQAREYRITALGRRRLSCIGAILDRFKKHWVCMVTLTYKKPPSEWVEDFARAFVKALNRFVSWWLARIEARMPVCSDKERRMFKTIGWGIEHQKNGSLHAHIVGLQKLLAAGDRLFTRHDIKRRWDKQFLAELKKINPEAYQWLKDSDKRTNAHVDTARKNVSAYVMKYAYKAGTIPGGSLRLKKYWGCTAAALSLMTGEKHLMHFSWPQKTIASLVEAMEASGLITTFWNVTSADGVLRCRTSKVIPQLIPLLKDYLTTLVPQTFWKCGHLVEKAKSTPTCPSPSNPDKSFGVPFPELFEVAKSMLVGDSDAPISPLGQPL